MKFTRDQNKADINEKKHDVTFSEAETVFGDPLALTFYDSKHSDDEDRWLTFGISESKEHLIVWHTETDNELRIIGVRKMDKKEKKQYENYNR